MGSIAWAGKIKTTLQLIAKSDKSKQSMGKTDSVDSQGSAIITIPKDLKPKVKSSDGSGMETDKQNS